MPTLEERLDRWGCRHQQPRGHCALTNATVTQIAALLMQPSKSDLGVLIKTMIAALQVLQDQMQQHGALVVGLGLRLGELPAEVPRMGHKVNIRIAATRIGSREYRAPEAALHTRPRPVPLGPDCFKVRPP